MSPEDWNMGAKGDVHCYATAQQTRSRGNEYASNKEGLLGNGVFC
jgi:hypothetical protein